MIGKLDHQTQLHERNASNKENSSPVTPFFLFEARRTNGVAGEGRNTPFSLLWSLKPNLNASAPVVETEPKTETETEPNEPKLSELLRMPEDLRAAGWRMSTAGGLEGSRRTFRAKNKLIQLSSPLMDSPELAIDAARRLLAGETPIVSAEGVVTWKPTSRADETARMIARKQIDGPSRNSRTVFDQVKLEELAASIREHGILEPLLVRPKGDRFEVVFGERRLRAGDMAALQELPCRVRELNDQQVDELQTIENDQREDLNPIERGNGYIHLLEAHGHTTESLAKVVGKSQTYVCDQIKLAKLPPIAREALLAGSLPISTAILIARVPNSTKRQRAAERIISPGYGSTLLSFRDAKYVIEREFSTQLKGAPFDRDDATLLPAAGPCNTCPKLTGNNRVEFPDGRADICTDPQCFNAKIAAHNTRTRNKAKETGLKVLPTSQCKRIFSRYSGDADQLTHDAPYIDLAEQCQLDTKKTKRSYKQLLEGEIEPVLAINPKTHRGRLLVEKTVAAKVLKEKHKIVIQVEKPRSTKTNAASAEKQQRDRAIFERATQLAAAEIAHQAEIETGPPSRKRALNEFARLMFRNSLEFTGGEPAEVIATQLNLLPRSAKEPSFQFKKQATEKFAKRASAPQLFGLILEVQFLDGNYGATKLSEQQIEILKLFPRVGPFEKYLDEARKELIPITTTKGSAKTTARK